MEISLFGSSKVYQSRPDVLGRSACGPAQTFSDVAPGTGLRFYSAAICIMWQYIVLLCRSLCYVAL